MSASYMQIQNNLQGTIFFLVRCSSGSPTKNVYKDTCVTSSVNEDIKKAIMFSI